SRSLMSPGLLSLLLVAIWGCHSQQPHRETAQEHLWKVDDPSYVPFKVREIFLSNDNRFAGVTVDEKDSSGDRSASELTIYLIDLNDGEHRRIGSGEFTLLTTSKPHQFVLYNLFRGSSVQVINGFDVARSFDFGEFNGGWWNLHSQNFMFATDPA